MKKKSTSFKSPSERHVTATVVPAQASKIMGQNNDADSIQKKDAEIQAEKEKSILKTKVRPGKVVFETKVFAEEETGPLTFLTRAVKEHFKLTEAIFKSNITRWDFPHRIGDRQKKISVVRYFAQPTVQLYVDVFNASDSQAEINRIKAHMEALGLRYTYFKGGDAYADQDGHISDAFKKLLFVNRLQPIDPKTLKDPVRVPRSLEEAGINQVYVQG